MQKNNGKYLNKKARLPLSVYLSYLLALTLVLGGVTSAKYTSQATGTATARVAKFDVEMNSNTTSLHMTHDLNDVKYPFTVTSSSEVAVSYEVVVSLSSALPNGVTLKLDNSEATSSTSTSYTFAGKTIAAGTNTPNAHELSITIDRSTLKTDYDPTVTVTVNATQVD